MAAHLDTIPRLSRVALTVTLCLSLMGGLPAQERAAIVQSIDLSVPFPPSTVPIDGRTSLVYELHITNFQSADVALSRLQVVGADRPGRTLVDYGREALMMRLGRPGLPRRYETPHLIGPGMRAVAYLWIELPAGSDPPAVLGHRVELDILRPSGPVHAVAESGPISVSNEPPLVLSPPLGGGLWVALYDPLLMGGHRTAIYTVGGRARIPARFAIDWIRLPASGVIEQDPARRPADWNGYGAEVLAVADATVAAAMDDIPENADLLVAAGKPTPPENASGNYVALDLGNGRFAFYEHLRRGSITVKAGARVKSGQVIGRLGHSGSSSIGPHLHFHVSDANSPLGAEGRPFVFTRFEHVGTFPSIDAVMAGETWRTGAGSPVTTRFRERPGANTVVRFHE